MCMFTVAIASFMFGQLPSLDEVKDAAQRDNDRITSFVLKAHGIETEKSVLLPDLESLRVKAAAAPFADFAQHAATRPAVARYEEKRYRESLEIGKQNVIAVRERIKPTPVKLVISCDMSIPAISKQFIDKRDVEAIAQSLKLGPSAKGTLSKDRIELVVADVFTNYRTKVGFQSKIRHKLDEAARIESQRLFWLGLLPPKFADAGDVAISSENQGRHIRIRVTSDGVRKEFVVDPSLNFRVIRYTATSERTEDVFERYEAEDYRAVQPNVSIPFKTRVTRMADLVPDSYSLSCEVDSFEVNPQIDSSTFNPPKGVRIERVDD